MPDGAKAYLAAALYRMLGVPVLLVVVSAQDAQRLYEELKVWCPNSAWLQFFPEPDHLSDECCAGDSYKTVERLRVFYALCFRRAGSFAYPMVVASAQAAASRTIPRDEFISSSSVLEVGMTIDLRYLLERCSSMGYEIASLVEVPGSIARRGGIVDIFSPDAELPVRIELSGNQIESIRQFDPKTQCSVKQVALVRVVPAKEEGSRSGNLLDYVGEDGLLIIDGIDEIRSAVEKLADLADEARLKEIEKVTSPSGGISWEELDAKIKMARRRLFLSIGNAHTSDAEMIESLPLVSIPSYGGKLQLLANDLGRLKENTRVVVVSQQVERLAEFLEGKGIEAGVVSEIAQIPSRGSVTLVRGSLNAGWALREKLALFTDSEIFGFVKQLRAFRKHPICYHRFTSELVPGDYVVHVEHGIGRFVGLTRMLVNNVEREYMVLEYAADDKLYVPVEQAERVSRYIGAGEGEPSLTRLGTQEWSRTKQRVRESMLNMARELLELYAKREVTPGFAFSRDTLWQQELEASFPYVETPDQVEAVNAVKSDMEKPRPMDRLVCGDVGYGKTEVALRAAFKAVMDGKQVVLLVPTTVLAQQHHNTFCERLQAFPVRVEVLSRFYTEKEQARVIAGLATGAVDICIGTHRLLQKDVMFKDLGLVIIDEEQRFGVIHKEYFKKLRQEVDVLTLSATPIPRTLHMALTGIRDMSIIETPPDERLPIRTYVGVYNEGLVRIAILREMERGGQVFYVHNRIYDIFLVAQKLKSLVPESRILVAHGRMPEDELEAVMVNFATHKADVLVTTTIIESGLDMPNVNTLIVDQADLLGLTQLYQLRGRIGRGYNNAHAYFFYDGSKELTSEARKRLKTIAEATELGAGFTVAMRDLEIRGAGNLLGVEQSGYVAAVGFDLYCRMLAEVVEELKMGRIAGEKPAVPQPPTFHVDLPLSAYIPEEYVPDLGTRLNFYRKLVRAKDERDVLGIARELIDRFGNMPEPVKNLLYIARIKQLAVRASAKSIFTVARHIVVQFDGRCGKIKTKCIFSPGVRAGETQIRIDTRALGERWSDVLEKVLRCLAYDEGEYAEDAITGGEKRW